MLLSRSPKDCQRAVLNDGKKMCNFTRRFSPLQIRFFDQRERGLRRNSVGRAATATGILHMSAPTICIRIQPPRQYEMLLQLDRISCQLTDHFAFVLIARCIHCILPSEIVVSWPGLAIQPSRSSLAGSSKSMRANARVNPNEKRFALLAILEHLRLCQLPNAPPSQVDQSRSKSLAEVTGKTTPAK
jgi:hypothetical protein